MTNLKTISTDGVSLHVTIWRPKRKDGWRYPKDAEPPGVYAADDDEAAAAPRKVKLDWLGGREPDPERPTAAVVTMDPGASKCTSVRVPTAIEAALEAHYKHKAAVPAELMEQEERDGKVRGNGQFCAGVAKSILRTKQTEKLRSERMEVSNRRARPSLTLFVPNRTSTCCCDWPACPRCRRHR